MSLKKIEQIKQRDRGFKLSDLIIYGAILALTAALFIAVFVKKDGSPLKGIKIFVTNSVVYEYDFEKGEISRNADFVEVNEQSAERIELKITADSGKYNVVEINVSGRTVSVTDANCPKKDCKFTPAIRDNGGFIYCLSHGVKILPYKFDPDNGNIIM